METLVEQARRLASGTIANLTGRTRYIDIDVIRAGFVEFCDRLIDPPEKWQDAWAEFENGPALQAALDACDRGEAR